jgi:predicted nucleic acid-binding protein
LRGHADYLVTGDKDLLILSSHKSVKPLKIVTPAEFIRLIG